MAKQYTYIRVPEESVAHLNHLPEMHPLAGLAYLIGEMEDTDKQYFMYALNRRLGVTCEPEHTDRLIQRWLDALNDAAAKAAVEK